MRYSIIVREDIVDAVTNQLKLETKSCSKANISAVAESIRGIEILLIWEDKPEKSKPLWVISNSRYLETIAYIDTYVKKYAPFSAFYRIMSQDSFIETHSLITKRSAVNTSIFTGIILAEALANFEREIPNPDDVPLQAYLSTISATLLTALNNGYQLDDLYSIVENWESSKYLLGLEVAPEKKDVALSFWIPILLAFDKKRNNIRRTNIDDFLPKTICQFLDRVIERRSISKSDWQGITSKKLSSTFRFEAFNGSREDGIGEFRRLLEYLYSDTGLSTVEGEVIIAAALSMLSSGTMDFLSLTLTAKRGFPLAAQWYMLFVGLIGGSKAFKTRRGIIHHINKHISMQHTLFSPVTSDISYAELTVALNERIDIVPFITEYNSVINVEVFPLVTTKFKLKRNSHVVKIEDTGGRSFSKEEYRELSAALTTANKIISGNTSPPMQGSLFKKSSYDNKNRIK